MQPTIGRTVLYKLSAYDAESVNQRRRDAGAFNRSLDVKPEPGQRGRSGHVLHTGNEVAEGDQYPAVVVRTFPGSTTINLKVLLDGNDDYWATSRGEGDDPARWSWPNIRPSGGDDAAATPKTGEIVHYVSFGTPPRPDGSQAFTSECRAAIVTAGPFFVSGTHDEPGGIDALSLCVLNPEGMFFNKTVLHHQGDTGHDHTGAEIPVKSYRGGTWHPAGHA